MSVTVFEALQNADINIQNGNRFTIQIAMRQLHNAVELLKKGYGLEDEVEPLLEKYGTVESVPDRENGKQNDPT